VTPVLQALFWLLSDLQVTGLELLPEQGAVIIAANHLTNFDVFPMQFAISRPIFYMAKAELHANPLLDGILRHLGSFPVNRGANDLWAISHAHRVLEHGQVLGLFPEGKRSEGKGLRIAKTGAARISSAMNCPVVPVAVDGTQRMFKRFPRRNQVVISIGAPIFPEPDLSPLELTDKIMFSLAEMLPPELRGVYAQKPKGFDH
jgi:1-acyl-sn-glycerol-3-phosphate acyltransferase